MKKFLLGIFALFFVACSQTSSVISLNPYLSKADQTVSGKSVNINAINDQRENQMVIAVINDSGGKLVDEVLLKNNLSAWFDKALRAELDLIGTGGVPQTVLMRRLYEEAVLPFGLDLQPFYDLLSAFAQDVVKTRYQNFAELADYCRRSANPVGRILLQLYGETDTRSLARSDGICTALQLINFWQDVAVDWRKGRVYIPQDDLAKFGVTEAQIAEGRADFAFQRLMAYQCGRAFKMLKAGAPLGRTLKGRIGFELRMIVVGGQIILQKLDGCRYNVFEQRPVLGKKDWWLIVKRAFLKK